MSPLQKAMLAVLGPLTPNLAVGNGLKPEWISRDPAVVAAYKADPLVHDRIAPRLARFIVDGGAFVRRVAPRWTVPTLLLYAGADRCVPPAGSAAFAAAAPAAVVTAREYPRAVPRDLQRTRARRGVIGLRRGAGYTDRFAHEEPAMNARDPLLPLQADEAEQLGKFAERVWDDEIVPALTDYIAVPAKSPMFDADWSQHGYIDRVVRDAAAWVERQNVAGLKLEVIRLEGRTPVIFFEVPATKPGSNDAGAERSASTATSTSSPSSTAGATTSGRGRRSTRTACSTAAAAPTTAMRSTPRSPRSRRSTGRASRGRAASASSRAARKAARSTCRPTSTRCGARLGNVGLVVCLDSGAGNYDQLWLTTSLRGMSAAR